jgi:hypothetical protein
MIPFLSSLELLESHSLSNMRQLNSIPASWTGEHIIEVLHIGVLPIGEASSL